MTTPTYIIEVTATNGRKPITRPYRKHGQVLTWNNKNEAEAYLDKLRQQPTKYVVFQYRLAQW